MTHAPMRQQDEPILEVVGDDRELFLTSTKPIDKYTLRPRNRLEESLIGAGYEVVYIPAYNRCTWVHKDDLAQTDSSMATSVRNSLRRTKRQKAVYRDACSTLCYAGWLIYKENAHRLQLCYKVYLTCLS